MPSKKEKTKSQSQTVQTPTTPGYISNGLKDYVSGIQDLQNQDPRNFVPGASSLQQTAFDQARTRAQPSYSAPASYNSRTGGQALGGDGFSAASSIARNVVGGGANTANVSLFDGAQLGGVTQANAANIGNITRANTAQLGEANQVEAGSVSVGPGGRATAGRGYTNIDKYLNPYTGEVVDTTLANYDEDLGRQRAAIAAAGARNGAFGGSRYGILEAQFESDAARDRAATEAGLRASAFDTAAGYSSKDADRVTSASATNAGLANQRALAQAQIDQSIALSNQNALNEYQSLQAQLQQQSNLFDAGAANDRNLTQAQLGQQANLFNAGAANDFTLNQGQLDQQTGLFNAGTLNDNASFNAGQQDRADDRGLNAAGILGNLASAQGANERADISQLATLGAQEREIEQQLRGAPITTLGAIGGLYNNPLLGAQIGQTVNQSGTSTTKTSDPFGQFTSLLNGIGSLASGA